MFVGGTVTSAGMDFYDVVGNGGTTTLGSAMTIGHDLTVSAGTFTTSVSGYALAIGRNLAIAGTLRVNGSSVSVGGNITLSGTFVAGTSTVTLDGLAGQSIAGPSAMTFYNLVAVDPGGVIMAANVSISNVLTLSVGSFTVGANTLTIVNPLAGTITNLVADGTSSITVNGVAAGIVMPSSVAQLNNLTLNNANGLGLQADLAVLGTLTLTNGPVTTGPYTLRIAPGGSVARTGGWVNGYLQKHAAAGAGTSLTFEVGDATRYAPATVLFGVVTAAGELTASTTSGDHPLVASSGIAPTLSANRFWTMTSAGVAFDTYDATFTFSAADLDVGANPTLFIVATLDGGTWTLPAVGTRTALSTQALAMTSFSDFQLGQPAAADLGVTVSDGLTTVTAGDGLSHLYTITVTNAGPSDATSVSLADSWPSGFVEGVVAPSQGSCAPIGAGPDFSCDLGTIGAGGSVTVTAAYTVPATTPGGTRTTTVSVANAVNDPDPTNDSATDSTDVIEVAALLVTKDDGLTSVAAGTTGLAYTITVTNSGPSDADGVVVDDSVPAGFSVGTPNADLGGDCSTSVGNTIQCTLPASLDVATTWTITVPYDVGPAVSPQTVTNTATALSDENPTGVSASDVTDLTAAADLGVTVSDGLTTVTAGDGLSHLYTITVTNAGPSDATSVSLADSWPSGFVEGVVAPSQGSCAPIGAGPDFSCDLGTIGAGGSVTVTAAYTVPATTPGGTRTTTVSVANAVNDPDPTNDSATDSTDVIEVAAPPPGGGLPPSSTAWPPGEPPGPDLTLAAIVVLVFLGGALVLGRPRTR